jgi:hypothetical protein
MPATEAPMHWRKSPTTTVTVQRLSGGLGDRTFGGAGNGHDPNAAWPSLGRPWQNERGRQLRRPSVMLLAVARCPGLEDLGPAARPVRPPAV